MTHIFNPPIAQRQIQIIHGTILGGSSIVKYKNSKNPYLSMRSKNGMWLDYKAAELHCLSTERPITIEKTNRWHSMCYPIFNDFRDKYYVDNQRKLKIETLNPLKDIALAIWFGDCGNYNGKFVKINTHLWGEDGTNIIVDYLNLCGYTASVAKERKCFRARLDEESSEIFIKRTSPLLPYFFKL